MAVKVAERDSHDTRPVLLLVQDEGRFGCINDQRRAWAPFKTRPQSPRQIVRNYLYAFTALSPALGKMTSLILPMANTEMMNLFLTQVAEDFKEYFIIMLMDQAGWHTSHRLEIPENIRLINFPPRSPELNPVEHIWEELKEKNFANKAFESLDEVEHNLCLGFNQLARNSQQLRSMTKFPYLNITL